jgi:group I intron endonuclease
MLSSNTAIYAIRNTLDGKFYIGSAVNANARCNQHRSDLRKNKHDNSYLQKAWNKHGGDWNFQFLLIELCDKSILIEREQWWMDITQSYKRDKGYNIRTLAENNTGLKHSDESKRKLSKLKLGISVHTEESKKRIGDFNRNKQVSLETRLKRSDTLFARQVNRNLEKWPCAEGSYCKCDECFKKKQAYRLEWKRNKNFNENNFSY